jgi:hypothetical protein
VGQDRFEPEVMLPEVTHVVFVDESLALAQLEIGKRDLVWVVGEGDPADARDAIRLTMNAELVQVQIFPAHRDLHDGMQLGDGGVAGHQQSPPDQRGDVTE